MATTAADTLCDQLLEAAETYASRKGWEVARVCLRGNGRDNIVVRLDALINPASSDPLPLPEPLQAKDLRTLRAAQDHMAEAISVLHRHGEPATARLLKRGSDKLARVVVREGKSGPKPVPADVAIFYLAWCWNEITGEWPKQARTPDGLADNGPFAAWAQQALRTYRPELATSLTGATPILQAIRRLKEGLGGLWGAQSSWQNQARTSRGL